MSRKTDEGQRAKILRITFINLARDCDWGGGESWTLATAAGLHALGHLVQVIGRVGASMATQAHHQGLQGNVAPVDIDYSPRTIIILSKLLRHFKTEVLVVHHNKDVRTGGVAAKLLNLPVVHRNGFPIILNTFRHRITYSFTHRILTNSTKIRDLYLSFGWISPDRIDVVPNGIKVPQTSDRRSEYRRKFNLPDGYLHAAYAGRLTAVKRVEDLIAVFSELPPNNRWRLLIFGRGNREAFLKNQVLTRKLTDRVRFFGFVENVQEVLGSMDLVLLPSEEEGMPNSLMEAMVRGVAVAATPVGDVPYLLDYGKAGWLMPVGNRQAFKELLLQLEANPAQLAAMGEAGKRRIVQTFTFDKMIHNVEKSLLRAIHDHQRN